MTLAKKFKVNSNVTENRKIGHVFKNQINTCYYNAHLLIHVGVSSFWKRSCIIFANFIVSFENCEKSPNNCPRDRCILFSSTILVQTPALLAFKVKKKLRTLSCILLEKKTRSGTNIVSLKYRRTLPQTFNDFWKRYHMREHFKTDFNCVSISAVSSFNTIQEKWEFFPF